MDIDAALGGRPIGLLGCGKMGAALLAGWRADGLRDGGAIIVDPGLDEAARDQLAAMGGRFADRIGAGEAAVVLLAVKPQMMDAALPSVASADGAMFLSIAAGLPISYFSERLPAGSVIVRSMPNTPAAVGAGITAICGPDAGEPALDLAETLLSVVGDVVRLDAEAEMDAVTAVSGSGPAYVFHMIEALAEAGVAEGLPPEMAMKLAVATVAGAGRLASMSDEAPAVLRENVTSKGGTTAAGLSELMAESDGLRALMRRTVQAAARRSRELGA